jgi:hypothetical protein
MGKALSEDERVRRQRWAADSRAAAKLGLSLEKCLAARAVGVETWTTLIRALMQEHGVDDPVAVLPELLAQIEQHAIGEARTTARTTAREEVRAMLKRAIT